MKHPYIIGAGGVASYLLPCLVKAFKPESITIIDKDVLEERNLDRQLFSANDIGKNKADALLNAIFYEHDEKLPPHWVIKDWFTESTVIPDTVDAIICVADNHEARRNAIRVAYEKNLRCYLGGNEYFDSEAFVTWNDHENTKLDPRIRYPLIATSNEGSPTRCQGEEQEAHPQLAVANFMCAAKLLHLIYAWERYYADLSFKEAASVKDLLPVEISSSVFSTQQLGSKELSK